MGSSSSKVTDYDRHDWPAEPPQERQLPIRGLWKDTLATGVMLGVPLGIGMTLIALAITGTLVTICGG